ncbi:MAG: right-handed parallel beta-helix repeat-containing protein, partial [Armatimonadota bacterium]
MIYEAYDGEKPILSGGRPLKAFQDEQGVYQGSLSDVKDGKWDFSQLWANGNRRFRPRVPKRGYSLIASDLPSSPESVGKGYDRFQFREGDIKSSWQNLADIDVVTFHSWTVSRLKIASLDDQSRAVKFTGRTVAEVGYFNLAQGNRYLIENVKEALSDPGEWYLDKPTGILSYIPDKGDQKKCEMIAPKLETLIKLQGDVDGRKWVQHVQFKGITFSHTNWVCPPGGYASPQAECYLGAAVSAEGARDCVFDGCTISHTGAYAIDLGAGCKRNTIQNCTLTDLGAGGVRIGLMAFSDDEKMASHNTVQNTTISHGGRLHPAGIGVWIGHSLHNIISHNDIYDLYYSGISCGWTWGYGQSQAHHNTLEYNHIHDIGQAVLSDMGGIYTLGVAPGSVERGNVIHDVNSFAYGGWGIYFDEGSTGWLAEKNLVYRCKTGNFHQHYGKNNVVHNNIFALAPQSGQLIRTRPEEHISYFLDHNIIYYNDAPLLGSNWTTNNNFRLDYNLYWNAGIVPISFAGMTLEEWRKKGNDIHSVVADPLFVDIAKDDFRLKPASPALQMGFVEWDTSKAGRTSGSEKSQAVALPRAFPLPAPPPPNPVSQD